MILRIRVVNQWRAVIFLFGKAISADKLIKVYLITAITLLVISILSIWVKLSISYNLAFYDKSLTEENRGRLKRKSTLKQLHYGTALTIHLTDFSRILISKFMDNVCLPEEIISIYIFLEKYNTNNYFGSFSSRRMVYLSLSQWSLPLRLSQTKITYF